MFVVPWIEWEFLPVAHRANSAKVEPELYKVFPGDHRATLSESQIVLRRATLVTMALDRNDPRRVPLQHFGVLLEDGAAADANL